MRFPLLDKLDLPCVFEQMVPGELHPDGRRYLPQLLLRPLRAPGLLLSVVDRHHRVDVAAEGRAGIARLVFALSALRLQPPPPRQGLEPEPGRVGVSGNPVVLGRVVEVVAWDVSRGQLPYEALYTELTLDIGLGVVGVRTSLTAGDLAASLGKARIEPGDYVELSRSRIDILRFDPTA